MLWYCMSAGAFDSRSSRLASIEPVGCFGLASISIQRCSGKRQFPRGPCIAGRCRCRLFVRLDLSSLSIWLVKRYTSLASIWPPLRRISLSTHIAPTTFTESEPCYFTASCSLVRCRSSEARRLDSDAPMSAPLRLGYASGLMDVVARVLARCGVGAGRRSLFLL